MTSVGQNPKLNNTYSASLSRMRTNQTPPIGNIPIKMSLGKGPSTSVALQIVRKQQSNDSKNNSRQMMDKLLCQSCLKLN
jgi:hypothetical protein